MSGADHMPALRKWSPMIMATASAKMFKHFVLRAMMMAWWAVTKSEINDQLLTEIKHLRKAAGRKANSIWAMNKDMLVAVAIKETPDAQKEDLEKMRKPEIQLLIKRARDAVVIEPSLPRGMTRMKHEELMREANMRGINTADTQKRYGVKVREQLIIDIKEYEIAKAHAEATAEFQARIVEEDFMVEGLGTASSTASSRPPAGSLEESSLFSHPPQDHEVTDILNMIRSHPRAAALIRSTPELLL